MFERFPGVHVDLAPGIEMLYNSSNDVDQARKFFIKYADRIILGTDITGGQDSDEAKCRLDILTRWLASGDEFRVPEKADILLGRQEDGLIRGMSLPKEVLEKIYNSNFEHLAGSEPKELNRDLAAKECERIAASVIALGRDDSNAATAKEAAKMLRG